MSKPIRMASFFSGIGGFEEASRGLGYEVVQMCEIDPFGRATLESLHPGVPIDHDITKFDGFPLRARIDIIVGGFPCVDISTLNQSGKGLDGERSGLWRELFRVIGEVEPDFVLVENVPALRTRGLNRVLDDMASIGYGTTVFSMGAIHAGAFQKRIRLWIVGYSDRVIRRTKLDQSNVKPKQEERTWSELQGEHYPFLFPPSASDSFQWANIQETESPLLMPGSQCDSCALDDGIPRESLRLRKLQLKALGNALVPACARPILAGIKELFDMMED